MQHSAQDTSGENRESSISWMIRNGSENNSSLPIDMQFNAGHQLQIIVYSILMIISAIGNITVLTLIIRRRIKTHSRIDMMLTHLAIADLMVTFLMMPLEIAWAYTVRWMAGDIMCRLMAFFRTFGLYLSSFVLVCISVDRYFAVLQPLKFSKSRGRIMIMMAWTLSSICSAPQVIIFHVEPHPNVTWYEQCVTFNTFKNEKHQIVYNILVMVFMYALPLSTIVCSYASIYMEIFRRSRMPNSDGFRRSSIDVLGRAKRKTLKMTITIVMVFVICWTPYYVMSIWYWLDRQSASSVDQRVQKGLFLFACTNSCMNPIVYGVYNVKLRRDRKSGAGKSDQSSIMLRHATK
ncbi:adipokinetic hormone/corazonin-related peptide receptor variant I [Toxorhynchites rutilus septentrionalis]|uniref:adipokinetic hormone/corazonin-related peptide receptor variant I n=1 Tax=Toxorhynchites rutilus septentrionalis TaxID=329112 RepID=UPI002479CB56|nr:adipokinetic hormone/corazonin-related peptide receptor variant I [Toxorhynchites rutilus septentrionalis]XP_055639937.1 adipokinetic hormone/corazonin-related peptide receptor variant I [Toxorhynchites rutilus septentrionalis]XP_055639938.1 adipokinetic hormone/corazonin-related peptide receptor variant I [Toxorhynchites rutilus septentrionalis]XP_055639939.1 adipokinetic hormone/corazonin-related peptide receptor variant I [Toxorhynchites rutilus septentrionalis]